jgi:hypothetical protein
METDLLCMLRQYRLRGPESRRVCKVRQGSFRQSTRYLTPDAQRGKIRNRAWRTTQQRQMISNSKSE